jgi:RNase H-fold protein (predicted Holliday junction resolvase)
MSVLAIDPGKKNTAFAFIKNDGTLVEFGMLQESYDILASNKEVLTGIKTIRKFVKRLNTLIPAKTVLVLERQKSVKGRIK